MVESSNTSTTNVVFSPYTSNYSWFIQKEKHCFTIARHSNKFAIKLVLIITLEKKKIIGEDCGYEDIVREGYGLNSSAAMSNVLFNNGQTCACYKIRCVNSNKWYKLGQPSLFFYDDQSLPTKLPYSKRRWSRNGNFAPYHPAWPSLPHFVPHGFSPPHKGDGARMKRDFSPTPRDEVGICLDFLDLTYLAPPSIDIC